MSCIPVDRPPRLPVLRPGYRTCFPFLMISRIPLVSRSAAAQGRRPVIRLAADSRQLRGAGRREQQGQIAKHVIFQLHSLPVEGSRRTAVLRCADAPCDVVAQLVSRI
jgi:hypothetical protein